MFEIYTMFSEIHSNLDSALGVKNFVEWEAELSMEQLKLMFLYRSVPVFPVHEKMIKPEEKIFAKVEAFFHK